MTMDGLVVDHYPTDPKTHTDAVIPEAGTCFASQPIGVISQLLYTFLSA